MNDSWRKEMDEKRLDELRSEYDGIADKKLRLLSAVAIAGRLNALFAGSEEKMRAAELVFKCGMSPYSIDVGRAVGKWLGRNACGVRPPQKARLADFTGTVGDDGSEKAGLCTACNGCSMLLSPLGKYSLTSVQALAMIAKNKCVTVSARGHTVTFPADFQLVAYSEGLNTFKTKALEMNYACDVVYKTGWDKECDFPEPPTFDKAIAAQNAMDASLDVRKEDGRNLRIKAVCKALGYDDDQAFLILCNCA